MLYFLQQLLNGFHSGALYALLAFGYALTNGVLQRTNLAHGALFAFAGQMMILVAVFGWQVLWLTLAGDRRARRRRWPSLYAGADRHDPVAQRASRRWPSARRTPSWWRRSACRWC